MILINNEEKILNLKEENYKSILGVDKKTFNKMYSILEEEFIKLHEKGGKPTKLSVLDKLMITLSYWREYRTYRNIAFDYGVGKSIIGNSIHWVENTLIKHKDFSLPSKSIIQRKDTNVCVLIVDVTEQEIERPKKNKNNGILEKRKNTQ